MLSSLFRGPVVLIMLSRMAIRNTRRDWDILTNFVEIRQARDKIVSLKLDLKRRMEQVSMMARSLLRMKNPRSDMLLAEAVGVEERRHK
jgi:hypothetical protein